MDKEKKELLVIVPFGCPLKGEELEKCKIYQEKEKTAEFVVFCSIPRPAGTEERSCLDRCFYTPTGEGDKTK